MMGAKMRNRLAICVGAVALAACRTGLDGAGGSAADLNPPPAMMTVSDDPSIPVVDLIAIRLTDAEVREIQSACERGSAVPGVDTCAVVIRRLATGKTPPPAQVDRTSCPPHSACVLIARDPGNSHGFVQLLDQRPGSSPCSIALCHGIAVPVDVVKPSKSASPSVTSTSGSTKPSTTKTSSSTPVPTTTPHPPTGKTSPSR